MIWDRAGVGLGGGALDSAVPLGQGTEWGAQDGEQRRGIGAWVRGLGREGVVRQTRGQSMRFAQQLHSWVRGLDVTDPPRHKQELLGGPGGGGGDPRWARALARQEPGKRAGKMA